MKFKTVSKVFLFGMKITHEAVLEFEDSSNVFGRALSYRQYMYKAFPGCEFELVKAERIK